MSSLQQSKRDLDLAAGGGEFELVLSSQPADRGEDQVGRRRDFFLQVRKREVAVLTQNAPHLAGYVTNFNARHLAQNARWRILRHNRARSFQAARLVVGATS